MGRARRHTIAVTVRRDPDRKDMFADTLGHRRGSGRADDPWQEAMSHHHRDGFLEGLPYLTPERTEVALQRLRELRDAGYDPDDPGTNLVWLTGAAVRSAHATGPQWQHWNDGLDSILLLAFNDDCGQMSRDRAMALLDPYWERLEGFREAAQHQIGIASRVGPGRLLELYGELPKDGPLSEALNDWVINHLQTTRGTYDQLTRGLRKAILNPDDGLDPVDRLYERVRDELLESLPDAGPMYNLSDILDEAILDPPAWMTDAFKNTDLAEPELFLKRWQELLDGPRSRLRETREAAAAQLEKLYGTYFTRTGETQQKLNDNLAATQQLLAMTENESLRETPSGQALARTLAIRESDAYGRIVTSMLDVSAHTDTDVRLALEPFMEQAQATMEQVIHSGRCDAKATPQRTTGLRMRRRMQLLCAQLSINGGHERFLDLRSFHVPQAQDFTAQQWERVWDDVLDRNWTFEQKGMTTDWHGKLIPISLFDAIQAESKRSQ